jgi:hypothetical protein
MLLRPAVTSILCLFISISSSASVVKNDIEDDSVKPYYHIKPEMILSTIKEKTKGKITASSELKMYLGNDGGSLQFCTPEVKGKEFTFGIIRFSIAEINVDWAELVLSKGDTAPSICDAIAQEGEPKLIEFYLSEVTGVACMEGKNGLHCNPFI